MANQQASIDKANHLILDQPLLRLPYELLRNNFRSAHFTVEKESAAAKNALREAATAGVDGRWSGSDEAVRSLDAMLGRLRAARRKLGAQADEEGRLYDQVDARASHLAELADMHSLDDVAYEGWSRSRLNRLLVDYLLRQGCEESAEALVAAEDGEDGEDDEDDEDEEEEEGEDEKKKLRALVDLETFAQLHRIRKRLLVDHSVTEALAWCADNKKELRKMGSPLEFYLRYQQYIELMRSQDPARRVEAVAHARRYLSPFYETFRTQFLEAGGLLCYKPPQSDPGSGSGDGSDLGDIDPSSLSLSLSIYASHWNVSHWRDLADRFEATHNQLLSLPSTPLLHLALSSGLSALKTPACHPSSTAAETHTQPSHVSHVSHVSHASPPPSALSAFFSTTHTHPPETANGSSVCPICSPELNELARHVPYAHHSKSHAAQDTVMLPNDHVYSLGLLLEYARKSGLPAGRIKDLRTGEEFAADAVVKVYIF